jgi:hypothetical protein
MKNLKQWREANGLNEDDNQNIMSPLRRLTGGKSLLIIPPEIKSTMNRLASQIHDKLGEEISIDQAIEIGLELSALLLEITKGGRKFNLADLRKLIREKPEETEEMPGQAMPGKAMPETSGAPKGWGG